MVVQCQTNSTKILKNRKIGNLATQYLKTGRIFKMKSTDPNLHIPPRLNAVLYFLYQFPNVQDEEHYSRLTQYLLKTHSNQEITEIQDAIKWGLNNIDFVFSDQLPNLRKTNDEILLFFSKLNQSLLENDEIMKRINSSPGTK